MTRESSSSATIRTRSGFRVITVARREIKAKEGDCVSMAIQVADGSMNNVLPLPELDYGPVASEVCRLLRNHPMRFPEILT